MRTEIIMFCVICDNLLRTMNIRDDIRVRTDTAEVMTVVLTAARFFRGNIRNAANFLGEHGYVPGMSGESRPNRRIHAIGESVRKDSSSFLRIFSK